MGMRDSDPLYSGQHRSTFLSSLMWYLGLLLVIAAVLSLAFSSLSIATRFFDVLVLFGLGALLAGSHWLMTPRRYEVYEGELVVVYGRPRVKAVPYSQVGEIEVKSHALGTELRLLLVGGGMVRLHPLNPKEFHENLERAWGRNREGWLGG